MRGNWLRRRPGTNKEALFPIRDGEETAPLQQDRQRCGPNAPASDNWTNAGWPMKCEGHAGGGGVISPRPHGSEMADQRERCLLLLNC